MIRWLSHPVVMVLSGILGALFFISLSQGKVRFERAANQVSELTTHVTTMQAENATLMKEIERTGSAFTQEKIARNQLLVKKPGEYVIQLVDDPRKKRAEPAPEAKMSVREAWIALLWGKS